jgi:hypothetical protein
MLLYGCKAPPKPEFFKKPQICGMGSEDCQTIIGIWGPGSDGECHPDAFGFPIGQTGFQYAILQLHWNNEPTPQPNLFDNSGMILYYTDVLRPNDGMVVMVGQLNLLIPPNTENITYEGRCKKDCSRYLKPPKVNIASAILHMHLLGQSGDIQLIRAGEAPLTIVEDHSYDYNIPEIVSFDKPHEFRAGDEIKVKCVYSSIGKNKTTTYGEGTMDEMCFGFITVYPAVPGFDFCSEFVNVSQCSMPQYNIYAENGCKDPPFTDLLKLVGQQCNGNCSRVCQGVIAAIKSTGCLDGSIGAFIRHYWAMFSAGLGEVFAVIDQCSAAVVVDNVRGGNCQNNTTGGSNIGSGVTKGGASNIGNGITTGALNFQGISTTGRSNPGSGVTAGGSNVGNGETTAGGSSHRSGYPTGVAAVQSEDNKGPSNLGGRIFSHRTFSAFVALCFAYLLANSMQL